MRSTSGAAALAAIACALFPASASADRDVVIGASGGMLYVDKQAATPVTGLSGTTELSIGLRPYPSSLFKVRALGFRADGTNIVLALSAELDVIGRHAGVTASVGFSRGAQSRGGNYSALGAFGRVPIGELLALRLDVSGNTVARNDFSGVGFALSAGVEFTWAR